MTWSEIVSWFEQHLLKCPSKQLFSFDCPGCGLQRSVIAYLKGDLVEGWRVYPPGILVVLTFIVLTLHLIFSIRKGAVILTVLYVLTTCCIIINYLYKIASHQLL